MAEMDGMEEAIEEDPEDPGVEVESPKEDPC